METATNAPARPSYVRALLGALLASSCALACVATVVCFVLVHINRQMAGNRDFVVYWATGRQLVAHQNPYDQAALTAIEHAAGLPQIYSVGYMRNPPWALPLAWPLGLLSLRWAAVLTSLVLLTAFVLSVRILLTMYGCRDRVLQALGYSFAPALICLIWGQTSLLVLPGLVLFLRWHGSRPYLAGSALWLCTLKPHLLLPFSVVLLLWIARNKRAAIIGGLAAAFGLSGLLTLSLDPHAWTQYAAMVGYSGVETDPIPTLSVLLRTYLAPHWMPLQFAPAALACVWAAAYFWQRRHQWDWLRDAPLVLQVSLIAAPYAYLNDHVVVLPALVFAASRGASKWMLALLAAASALLEIAFFVNFRSHAPFYWATVAAAVFWLVWYGLAGTRESTAATR